jgi:glutamate transport system substrate-binding protein
LTENDADIAAGASSGRGRPQWLPIQRLRLIAFVTVLVVVIAAVVVYLQFADPTEADLRADAKLIGKTELLVGVKSDVPGVAQEVRGQFTGFDIDIAYMIAAGLGFSAHEVRFLRIEDEDRSRMFAWDAAADRNIPVDLVIASYSVTEEREKAPNVSFSTPYLETEQSVMTRRDHPDIHDLADLAGEGKVCTLSTSTSASPASEAGLDIKGMGQLGACVKGLRTGEFVAITTDAPLIAGFVDAEPTVFKHHDVGLATPELWAVNTGANEPLRTLVNLILYRSRNDLDDRRWEEAYDRNLRPLEKASLPQPIAIDQQPDVPEVEVRQWPWE